MEQPIDYTVTSLGGLGGNVRGQGDNRRARKIPLAAYTEVSGFDLRVFQSLSIFIIHVASYWKNYEKRSIFLFWMVQRFDSGPSVITSSTMNLFQKQTDVHTHPY